MLDRDFHFVSVNPAFTPHHRLRRHRSDRPLGEPARQRAARPGFLPPGARGSWSATAAGPARCGSSARTARNSCAGSRCSAVLDAGGQRSHYVARAHRHHRQEARRAGTALPGQLRHADQPAQPRAAVRAPVARDRARAPPGKPHRGAVPRPRPLQGHQRFARPRRRRPHPARRRRAPAADRRRRSTRSRAWAATNSRWCWKTSTRRRKPRRSRARSSRRSRRRWTSTTRQDVAITPSIGISLYPDHAQVPTDLLKHADTAMYQAKAAGRRTYMRYTESMDVAIRRRATISARAAQGARPQRAAPGVPAASCRCRRRASPASRRCCAGRSPEYGEIPPTQFIPLAEESGLILEIGEWALREACHTLQALARSTGSTDLTMAVNVSALQLLRGDLPNVVARVLEETGVPADASNWNSPRAWSWPTPQQTAATLQAFRELGVSAGDRRLRHRLFLAGLPQAPADHHAEDRQGIHRRPHPRRRTTRRSPAR